MNLVLISRSSRCIMHAYCYRQAVQVVSTTTVEQPPISHVRSSVLAVTAENLAGCSLMGIEVM